MASVLSAVTVASVTAYQGEMAAGGSHARAWALAVASVLALPIAIAVAVVLSSGGGDLGGALLLCAPLLAGAVYLIYRAAKVPRAGVRVLGLAVTLAVGVVVEAMAILASGLVEAGRSGVSVYLVVVIAIVVTVGVVTARMLAPVAAES